MGKQSTHYIKFHVDVRLAESLATIQEMAAAERGTENARMAIIRARGEAARGQTQTVIDVPS